MKFKTQYISLLLLVFISLLPVSIFASEADCGKLDNGFGPFDYLKKNVLYEELQVVEVHHFTSEVEQLIQGKEGYIWADIDYTLRAFPNHHRALFAMARYQLKHPTEHISNQKLRSIECYFDRASRLSPNDAVVYMVWGIYLHKQNKNLRSAEEKYKYAMSMGLKSSEIYYNYGLLLYDLKQYNDSKKMAEKAYKMGFPLLGLKKKLQKINAW